MNEIEEHELRWQAKKAVDRQITLKIVWRSIALCLAGYLAAHLIVVH